MQSGVQITAFPHSCMIADAQGAMHAEETFGRTLSRSIAISNKRPEVATWGTGHEKLGDLLSPVREISPAYAFG